MVIFHSHVNVYQRVFDIPFEESRIVEDSWGTSQDGAWKSPVIKYLGTLRHKPTGRYDFPCPKKHRWLQLRFSSAMILPRKSHDSSIFELREKLEEIIVFIICFLWTMRGFPWFSHEISPNTRAQPGAVGHHPCVVRHQPWSLSLWQSSLKTGLIYSNSHRCRFQKPWEIWKW